MYTRFCHPGFPVAPEVALPPFHISGASRGPSAAHGMWERTARENRSSTQSREAGLPYPRHLKGMNHEALQRLRTQVRLRTMSAEIGRASCREGVCQYV